MILLFVVPLFVGCCTILWIYWDHFKNPPKPRRIHKIFISADCWLCVFDLLPLSQLGLGIAMISHRFDIYVDEHFKTRKWTLALIRIRSKIGKNGTKKMEIVNKYWKPMPIPQIQMPRKVIGFERITIFFIDRNAIAFLRHFRQLFTACPINLFIDTNSYRILKSIWRNIWPMLGKNIHGLELSVGIFHRLSKFVPSILNDCQMLRIVKSYFIATADDNAMASDGQAVAKWLFTPLQSNVPKVFKCALDTDYENLVPNIEDLQAAFVNASSPANFIVCFWFPSPFADTVEPYDFTNELTREQLTLKRTNYIDCFLLVRCPIVRDESKWTKWEKEAIKWQIYDQCNKIEIRIDDERQIGDGLLTQRNTRPK